MYSIHVWCNIFLHSDRKSTGTSLDNQPMHNTVMYIYIKWFVRMINEYRTKSVSFPCYLIKNFFKFDVGFVSAPFDIND